MDEKEPSNLAKTEKPSTALVIAAFLAVYAIWGSTYLGIRIAIETIPPFFMAGTRFLVAGGVMFLIAVFRGANLPSPAEWRAAFIVGGCLLLAGNGGVTFAEQYVPSGTAALLVATVPIFLTIFAWLFRFTSRPNRAVLSALLLGLVGVFILSQPDQHSNTAPSAERNWYFGVAALLIASAVWAAGSLYSKRAMRPRSAILSVGAQMIAGGALLLVVSFLSNETIQWNRVNAQSLSAWCYLVIFGAIVAFTAYIWLIRVCSPSLAGTYAFVNPVVAVFLGSLLAGEEIGLRTICGATIVVVAVAVVILFANRPPKVEGVHRFALQHPKKEQPAQPQRVGQ
jgi:drug/metabolite transporter (DMT)-like permease